MDVKKKVISELSELYLGFPARFRLFLGNKELNIEGGTNDFMVKADVIFESGYTYYKNSNNPSKLETTGGYFFKKLKKDYSKGVNVQSIPHTGKFITALLADEKIPSLTVTTHEQNGAIVTEIVSNMNPMAVRSPLKQFYFVAREYADYAEIEYRSATDRVVHTLTLKKGIRLATEMKKFVATV